MSLPRPLRASAPTSGEPDAELFAAVASELKDLAAELRTRDRGGGGGGGAITIPQWLAATVVGALLALLVTVATFAVRAERNLDRTLLLVSQRLGVIEETRFSETDAERLRREIMNEVNARIPTPETQRRLSDHDRRLEQLERGR